MKKQILILGLTFFIFLATLTLVATSIFFLNKYVFDNPSSSYSNPTIETVSDSSTAETTEKQNISGNQNVPQNNSSNQTSPPEDPFESLKDKGETNTDNYNTHREDPFKALKGPGGYDNSRKAIVQKRQYTRNIYNEAEDILSYAEQIGCQDAIDAAENAISYYESGRTNAAAAELSNAESYLDDCRSNRGSDDNDEDSEDDD
jgi:hypothetical protein